MNSSNHDEELLLAPPERQQQIEDMWQMLTQIGLSYRHQETGAQTNLSDTTIPLSIISGFLGAGKTTLLNRLLSEEHGLRLAVIVNDFGSVNIDASLIQSQDSDIIGLENGCVCCTSSDALGDTLDRLTKSDQPLDAIVLESSGISDPLNTAHVALVNPRIKLDAVVTVVDSETVLERMDDSVFGHLVKRQLEGADIVILNKTDLVDEMQMSGINNWFSEHLPSARCIEAKHGQVPVDLLLGTGGSQSVSATTATPEHEHTEFETWLFTTGTCVDRAELTKQISQLPRTVLRAKGILQLADDPDYQTVFQAVGRRWEFVRGERWGEGPRQSNLVIIGLPEGLPDDLNELNLLQPGAPGGIAIADC